MHRFSLPKNTVSLLVAVIAFALMAAGQAKPVTEISVSRCWAYPMAVSGAAIATDSARVFIGAEGAKIETLSLDGKKMWSSELGGDLSSNLLASEKGLVLATSTEKAAGEKTTSVLRSLSKETGITNWTLKLPDAARFFIGLHNGSVIVVSKSGTIQSVDAGDGSIKWKRDIADGFVAEPVFSTAKLIVAAKANQIFSVSLASGEIESMRKSVYAVTSLGELASGEIVVGDERGNVSTLNGTDKPLWKFKSGGEISRLFVSGDSILATSHDNFIYYLLARNGDIDWKKRLGGRALHLANIADKYVLSMSFEENSAVFTDLSTGKVAGQIVFGAEEKLVANPVSANGSILMLTNQAAYSYSQGNCGLGDASQTGK
ncbi:MAG: PQQ-binding-like beta-propeller repeat protein [Pyrinomonadaceae bacterium]